MTDSRRKNGYVAIANEIWDEVIRRDFTKRQKDILFFIWRLSYGCNQQVAVIPMQKDFSLCGVGKGHIGAELKHLETCKVITRTDVEYCFNENYDLWKIDSVRGWEKERFQELIHLNLKNGRLSRQKVTETGTEPPRDSSEKPPDDGYRNSNSEPVPELPKQEPEKNPKVTETGTGIGNELPKQELAVTETGTQSADEPIQDGASQPSKDSLKTLKDKDSKDMSVSDFETFWSTYPKKVAKKSALNMWGRAIKAKVDPALLIRCSENYAAHCKLNRTEDNFILHGSTFLNPKNERYADFEAAPEQTTVAPVIKGQGNSRSDRNKDILQKRMEAARFEQSRGTENFGGSGYSLPHSGTH